MTHNPASGVTGGIWRVRRDGQEVVCKLLTPADFSGPRDAAVPPWWTAADDPRHWNFWQREQFAYQERAVEVWAEGSLDMPRLLDVVPRPDRGVELWLEAVEGDLGTAWTLDQFGRFARALGRGQARVASVDGAATLPATVDRPWFSRNFLASYTESKPASDAVLHDDERWRHPLVASTLGPLRPRLVALRDDRHRYFELLAGLPRTVCHLDTWVNNLIARPDGRTAILDWAFTGEGALGEDPGNLVPDSVFDHFIEADELRPLSDTVTAAFLDGVADSGWGQDERLALLGMRASAVKYHWLAPLLLERADDEVHVAYGGRATVDPLRRYRDRAAGLELLCDWADEARALARSLGRW